jgi:hypothetical protein
MEQPKNVVNNWTENPNGSLTVEFSSARHAYNTLYGGEQFLKEMRERAGGMREKTLDEQVVELSELQANIVHLVEKVNIW